MDKDLAGLLLATLVAEECETSFFSSEKEATNICEAINTFTIQRYVVIKDRDAYCIEPVKN